MKLINCPIIGECPSTEFIFAGAVIANSKTNDTANGRQAIFNMDGTASVKPEWWYHTPSQNWFIITRDTANDEIKTVMTAKEYFHG